MISADQALRIILNHVRRLGIEKVPLSAPEGLLDSLHRFLARPVRAPIPLPPFDNAAMDGHAVRSRDTRPASGSQPVRSRPVSLKVIGTVAAGEDSSTHLRPGEAIRIMTGAPIPRGADAVIPLEETETVDGHCLLRRPVARGENVRYRGEDVSRGETVLPAGERITPRTIALFATLGINEVSVFRRPTVTLLITGDELVSPGTPLGPGKIYNSNGPALEAALKEIGIKAQSLLVADDPRELKKAVENSLQTDLLITVGGVSTGDRDFLPVLFEELGVKKLFHKVAIKPGKPLWFGTFGGKPVFGLPGNPVSAYMVFQRFVRPALLKMMGANHLLRTRQIAIAGGDLRGTSGREDYLRGIVTCRNGRFQARSAGPQGSAQLMTLARSNAVVIIPARRRKIAANQPVEVEIWGPAP